MTEKLATRTEVPDELKWNLKDLYSSDDAFEQAAAAFKEKLKSFGEHEGHVADSAESLYKTFSDGVALDNELKRLYVYCMTRDHSDTTNPQGTKLLTEGQGLFSAFGAATAFLNVEVTRITSDEFKKLLSDEPRLEEYKRYIEVNFLRNRDHILPTEQEKILAKSDTVFNSSENIYSNLNDADIKFGEVKDENGDIVELTPARYSEFMNSTNRGLRKQVSENFKTAYKNLQHTFAATLTAHMNGVIVKNQLHNFKTAREGELFQNEIPESVYDTLVTTVHNHLDGQHRYMQLRKDVMGLNQMYGYDTRVPLVGGSKLKFTFSESKSIVLDALKILGDDYVTGLKHEFSEGWIDAAENVGKYSGGYQIDVYGVHPYVLLNWSDNYDGLTTLAHESGHAMQSYLTDQFQAVQNTDYPIFTAEIASTTNENLLMAYMLDKYADNKAMKAYLLQTSIETFIGTVNTQAMYAEFEHQCYETVEDGEPLTADRLGELYGELDRQYDGPALSTTSKMSPSWAGIPHFYMNYYVYQYATSMAISMILADRIYRKVPGALEQYKAFLKAGSSQAPIDLIKQAGVDVTSGQYLDDAFAVLDKRIAELKELLGK